MSSAEFGTSEHPSSETPRKPGWWERFIMFVALGCGLGLVPFAPGTFGSLAGPPLAWGIQELPEWAQWLAPLVCFLVGVPICGIAARGLGLKDPGPVVFDEIAAFSVVFLGVHVNAKTAVLGFVLFRVFDITKPWPARQLERLPGGWGIMADDFAAAAYAGGILWLIAWWVPLG
ncbi:MAG TPA: phosphatidylglycerophosphatase A [Planctomycetaceae bacterium]